MEQVGRLQGFLWIWWAAFWVAINGSLGPRALVAASSPSWTIYHSWNGGADYTRRGVVEWKEGTEGEEAGLVVTNDQDHTLTKEEVHAMLDFGWYSVKIETKGGDDYVMATVPACSLRRANFKDEFALTFPRLTNTPEEDQPMISSLAYTPLISPLAPDNCENLDRFPPLAEQGPIPLASRVQAAIDTPGMIIRPVLSTVKAPPGIKRLAHPNARKGSAAKAPGGGGPTGPGGEEEKDNRPFFIKYWYVVLPLMLANLMPQEQPGAPEGAAAAAGAATAGAATAAVAASPAGKSRRGKRA